MAAPRGALGAGLAIALLACARTPASGMLDAGPKGAGSSSAQGAGAEPPAGSQPKYLVLGALNVLLRPHLGVLLEHFGGEGDEPLLVERIDWTAGRTMMLVSRLDEQDPVVLVVDRGRLAWSKPFPTAGTASLAGTITHLALAPRLDGGVALFGCASAQRAIAGRLWGPDGTAAEELPAVSVDGCDSLSVAYAAGLGWVAAATSPSGVRAALWKEDGRLAWGEQAVAIAEANPIGAVTLVADASSSFVVVERVQRGDVEHLFVSRYDAQGKPRWATPVDLGVPRRIPYGVRLDAGWQKGGAVRVELPNGMRDSRAKAVEVAPDGNVRWMEP